MASDIAEKHRFDSAVAWADLTSTEQAEIGRLAIESTVCVFASFPDQKGRGDWPCDPIDCLEEIEAKLDKAVADGLRRLGVLSEGIAPPPPTSIDGVSHG